MKTYTSSGWIDGDRRSHYGVILVTTKPTTGVVSNKSVEFLADACTDGSAIDLAWEEHCLECQEEEHDNCGEFDRGTLLIGAWIKIAGLWAPDTSGEFSAIVGESYTQVVWSRHAKRAALCSPCYPGQGDLNSPSESGVLCYDLPPDLYGSAE